MNFNENLSEFEFNLETLDFLKSNNVSEEKIINEMSDVNFTNELTNFILITKRSLLKSILKRLILCNQYNKSKEDIYKSFNKYKNMMPLIKYFYNHDVESNNTKKVVEEKSVEDKSVEDNSFEEVSEDDENPLDSFFQQKLKVSKKETDTLKASECYNAFRDWYEKNEKYEDEIPDKKMLKAFLNTRLEKKSKSSWKYVIMT